MTTPPPPAPPGTPIAWFYDNGGVSAGPVDGAALAALIARGIVGGETLVWTEGMADWQPARSRAELMGYFDSQPPPLPPVAPADDWPSTQPEWEELDSEESDSDEPDSDEPDSDEPDSDEPDWDEPYADEPAWQKPTLETRFYRSVADRWRRLNWRRIAGRVLALLLVAAVFASFALGGINNLIQAHFRTQTILDGATHPAPAPARTPRQSPPPAVSTQATEPAAPAAAASTQATQPSTPAAAEATQAAAPAQSATEPAVRAWTNPLTGITVTLPQGWLAQPPRPNALDFTFYNETQNIAASLAANTYDGDLTSFLDRVATLFVAGKDMPWRKMPSSQDIRVGYGRGADRMPLTYYVTKIEDTFWSVSYADTRSGAAHQTDDPAMTRALFASAGMAP